MFKTFLKRHEDSQDRSKITAIPNTTYELLRNTNGIFERTTNTNTVSKR